MWLPSVASHTRHVFKSIAVDIQSTASSAVCRAGNHVHLPRIAVEAFHDGFEQATEAFKRNQRAVAGLAEARQELVATSEALSKAEQENKAFKLEQVR